MFLQALGIDPITVVNNLITDGSLTFQIVPECTPIFSIGFLVGFLAFYPSSIRDKAVGLLMGIPALYLGNVARLMITFIISRHNRNLFDLIHGYLGQVFTVFLLILVCIAWLKWRVRKEAQPGILSRIPSILGRFVLISGVLFIVWNKLQFAYVRLLQQIAGFGFSLFNLKITFVPRTILYYETFSLVTFFAIVLAVRPVPVKLKIKGLAAGVPILFLMHLFHQISNVLTTLNMAFTFPYDMTLLLIGEYLLPVLPLFYMLKSDRSG